ncbi:MAG: AMP-binding protein [Clostridiaceae bacterium]|nr:AMP-binding protein [Clostridiaceae bacterium]
MIERYCRTDFTSYEDFFNHFTIHVPENFNFTYDIIDEWAALEPDKTALVWCNDLGDERTFTFTEISRLSKKAASAFKSLGLRRGDSVMLMVKRRWEFWVIVPALCRLGVTVIPATFLLTSKDIAYRAELAGIKMLIAVPEDGICANIEEGLSHYNAPCMKGVVGGKRDGYLDIDALIDAGDGDFVRPTGDDATQNDDIMLGYFTSGTSGMPSLVVHDYVYPLGHILTAKFWQDLREDDLHLTVADTGWAKCSWGKLYGQWICGAALFVYDYGAKFHPTDLLREVEKHNVTSFCAPPTVYRFLIKEDLSKFHLSSLRKSHTAGEPLNPEVFNRWKEFTGLEIHEGFGQSETPVLIATTKWTEPHSGSTGMPMPWMNIKLIDENHEEAEIGSEGEICIPLDHGRPAGLVCEYKGNPQKNAAAFHDGYYHTGDIAWKDEQGYIWFVGRNDDVIKSSGYRIGPFEVESALMEHPAVLETAITAVPDAKRGQIVKATVVLTKGYQPSDALIKELQEHVKRVTAPYKYPRIVEFVDELPKTTSGKIRRVDIRKRDADK